ncbi:MAG: 4Fe-4S double cluster binding domain-containing protein [Candidatus Thorarchaeota archaeon]
MTDRIWEIVKNAEELPKYLYKYSTISIDHLHELKDDFKVLDAAGKISGHPVFRKYIGYQTYEVPETFPDAKSVIVIAVSVPLMTVNFHHEGSKHEILVPHYYDDGVAEDQLKMTIKNRIIGHEGYRIENAKESVLFKRLAVRSGLGKYGRNNLCYVDGFGSFLRLHAFFSDFEFGVDKWTDAQMMDSCENCQICKNNCPTGSISRENFVIDVGKCIPLYNEVQGEFPEWMSPSSHNALMGCMKCQLNCPVNETAITQAQQFNDISEEETMALLEGNIDGSPIDFLWTKLRLFKPEDAWYFVPVFSRNLRALLCR